jgi:hypothetical protein
MTLLYRLLLVALLGLTLASCSKSSNENAASTEGTGETTAEETGPVARGESAAVQFEFSVEAVDVEKRLITLKGPSGNVGQFEVGEQVQRLAEIKPGDKIHGEYKVAAVAELREPTEEEKGAPVVDVTTGARGTADEPPAAGVARAVQVVTTIDTLDPATQSITVKGPEGNTVTAHVEDPAVFGKLAVGQSIVVTFAETLGLAVEPGAK